MCVVLRLVDIEEVGMFLCSMGMQMEGGWQRRGCGAVTTQPDSLVANMVHRAPWAEVCHASLVLSLRLEGVLLLDYIMHSDRWITESRADVVRVNAIKRSCLKICCHQFGRKTTTDSISWDKRQKGLWYKEFKRGGIRLPIIFTPPHPSSKTAHPPALLPLGISFLGGWWGNAILE